MEDYLRKNREHWNELTPVHELSEFYDVNGFRSGKSTLKSIELDEVGEVSGKSLLHLQCHFGLDTLSWARLGARVTGVDFSDRAIALARSLSRELGIQADFVQSSIYDLPKVMHDQFDIVFTSYGVLCWLPDLTQWAKVIASFLRPGSVFYIAEDHPLADVFYYSEDANEVRGEYSYFHSPQPMMSEPGDYADPGAELSHGSYQWTHSLGDILNALIGAGMSIDFLHEFPVCCWQRFPFMHRDKDGWWRFSKTNNIPLTFSLKARKAR